MTTKIKKVAKSPLKKIVSKAKSVKAIIKRNLIYAEPGAHLWIHFGPIVGNLKDFLNSLRNMDAETFRYHVNEQRNDFAKWVEDIMQDQGLAKLLQSIKEKKKYVQAVEKHLKKYYR